MLVFSRKIGEQVAFFIDQLEVARVTLLGMRGAGVRIGFQCRKELVVLRAELVDGKPDVFIKKGVDMLEKHKVEVDFNSTYEYLMPSRNKNGEMVQYGLYRPIRIATEARTYQEQVVVDGIEGPDKGHTITCSLDDFRRRYRKLAPAPEPVVTAEPPSESPGRGAAGYKSESVHG